MYHFDVLFIYLCYIYFFWIEKKWAMTNEKSHLKNIFQMPQCTTDQIQIKIFNFVCDQIQIQITKLAYSNSNAYLNWAETDGIDPILLEQSGLITNRVNTLRPRQNGSHFADDVFKGIFLNENIWILIKISLKFVPDGPIGNIPPLVQKMAWCRSGDKFNDAYMRRSASMS